MSLYPSLDYGSAQHRASLTLPPSSSSSAGRVGGEGEESPLLMSTSVNAAAPPPPHHQSDEGSKKVKVKKSCFSGCMDFFVNDSSDSYVDSLLACNFLYRSLKFFSALLITFGIEMGNSAVLGNNQVVLEKHFTLVLFIPVISAIAGNVGLQTSSSVTAYINLRIAEGRPVRVKFLLAKYFSHCIVQIITLALLMGLIACFCYKSPCQYAYGIIICCGALVNMGIAAFAGVWTPILLNKFGYDPSSGAGPFETALQDVVGAVFFVWFAKEVLNANWLPHCTL